MFHILQKKLYHKIKRIFMFTSTKDLQMAKESKTDNDPCMKAMFSVSVPILQLKKLLVNIMIYTCVPFS